MPPPIDLICWYETRYVALRPVRPGLEIFMGKKMKPLCKREPEENKGAEDGRGADPDPAYTCLKCGRDGVEKQHVCKPAAIRDKD